MLDDLAGIHDRHFVAQLGEDASLLKMREGRRERRAGAALTMPAGMARRCFNRRAPAL